MDWDGELVVDDDEESVLVHNQAIIFYVLSNVITGEWLSGKHAPL